MNKSCPSCGRKLSPMDKRLGIALGTVWQMNCLCGEVYHVPKSEFYTWVTEYQTEHAEYMAANPNRPRPDLIADEARYTREGSVLRSMLSFLTARFKPAGK